MFYEGANMIYSDKIYFKFLDAMLDRFIAKRRKEPSGDPRVIGRVVFWAAFVGTPALSDVDFIERQKECGGETFSEMLIRLVDGSGEKPSAIYNRANIDRRHFSKICNHKNYQPSKQTVLAFAIALKLDFDKTQKLLATAGYTLGNSMLSDMIVSFFIEYKIYDVDLINQFLYKYKLALLGG